MKQIYDTELDELLFQKNGKGIRHYDQDEKENIFLESLKEKTTLFDLAKKTGRGGLAILAVLSPQYPEGRKERLPKEEGKEIIEEVKTKSIKAICDKHQINPKRIEYLLVARAYAKPPKTLFIRGSWTKEEDDLIYNTYTGIMDYKGGLGKARLLTENDLNALGKVYKEAFGRKRTDNALRTRLTRLRASRESLGYLARTPKSERVAPQQRPAFSVGVGERNIDLKDFKRWIQTKGIDLYLKEKGDELRKEVKRGI